MLFLTTTTCINCYINYNVYLPYKMLPKGQKLLHLQYQKGKTSDTRQNARIFNPHFFIYRTLPSVPVYNHCVQDFHRASELQVPKLLTYSFNHQRLVTNVPRCRWDKYLGNFTPHTLFLFLFCLLEAANFLLCILLTYIYFIPAKTSMIKKKERKIAK